MADEYVRMKKSTLTAIGDSIRKKEESTELIPPLEMPTRIEAIGGGVEYTTGTATFTQSYNGQTIPHGLGKVPKIFFLYFNNYKTEAIYLSTVLYTENISVVCYASGNPLSFTGAYVTVPDVYVPPYGAVAADETNVYITKPARQWAEGDWTWEAYVW